MINMIGAVTMSAAAIPPRSTAGAEPLTPGVRLRLIGDLAEPRHLRCSGL
jgi:hypothetical protein